jgi:hypothetical protein
MSLQTLSTALEALIADEIAGKQRLESTLDRQELAIVAARSDDLDVATRAVELELEREMDRARRRDAIFSRMAAHWGISARTLTLASIVERLGPQGDGIARMRVDLRARIAAVLRKNRRVARLVSVQSTLVNDTVAALIGVAGPDQEPGALFEARG